MLKKYNGPLGTFEYDDTEFLIYKNEVSIDEEIKYIGGEISGKNIHIPAGIIDCSHMFKDTKIESTPIIPVGVKICKGMFSGCKQLSWATDIPEGVINCRSMFSYCSSLITVPKMSESVQDCGQMFLGCLKLSNFKADLPDSIENATRMFFGCKELSEVNKLPQSLKYARQMFSECRNLRTCGDIPKGVVDCTLMFAGCKNLEQIKEPPEDADTGGMYTGCINIIWEFLK